MQLKMWALTQMYQIRHEWISRTCCWCLLVRKPGAAQWCIVGKITGWQIMEDLLNVTRNKSTSVFSATRMLISMLKWKEWSVAQLKYVSGIEWEKQCLETFIWKWNTYTTTPVWGFTLLGNLWTPQVGDWSPVGRPPLWPSPISLLV